MLPRRRRGVRGRGVWLAGFLLAVTARGEQLPVRVWSTADGLPSNRLNGVFQDRRGFIWTISPNGASRFDGQAFLNFGAAQGLPVSIWSFAETRDGSLWFGTSDGLARLRADSRRGEPQFELFRFGRESRENSVQGLLAHPSGALWVGTSHELWLGRGGPGAWHFERLALAPELTAGAEPFVAPQLIDAEGGLWLAVARGLVRTLPDGRRLLYRLASRELSGDVYSQLDRAGRLWVYTSEGLLVWLPEPAAVAHAPRRPLLEAAVRGPDAALDGVRLALPERPGEALRLGEVGNTPDVLLTPRGAVLLRTGHGLSRLENGVLRPFARGGALGGVPWLPALEDRSGNLWAFGPGRGMARIRQSGFLTYTREDGLPNDEVRAVFEDRDGELLAITGGAHRSLALFDGRRFLDVTPAIFRRLLATSRDDQIAAQSADGDWWFSTWEGLLRLRACAARDLAKTPVVALYTTAQGFPGSRILQLFRAHDGTLWISHVGQGGALRMDPVSGRVELPPALAALPHVQSFAEDRAGNLWASLLMMGGVVRWRDGALHRLTQADGLPAGATAGLFVDSRDRLWIATGSGGVVRLDDASALRPRLRRYTTADGLGSDSIRCVTADARGRIYLGSETGLDRLDPESGRAESFTSAEGFLNAGVQACGRDRRGRLWFATPNGLTRFDPAEEAAPPSPEAWLSALRVAGVPQPMAALGARDAGPFAIGPDPGTVQIDFLAVAPEGRGATKFQYRLAPNDRRWSEPTTERSVLYGALAPDAYRFLVRAIGGEGLVSAPAALRFTILAPVWRRTWFVALAALLVLAAAAGLYRVRVRHLVALERVRTRIASDLHDDLGASLSRIAVLSDVAAQQAAAGETAVISEIGESARELVAAMSDIVWSIDPRRDDIASLAARLRRFASDLLEERGVELQFEAPGDGAVRLPSEARREVYLILKEAIHNAARHASASRISVRLAVAGDVLTGEVADDGRGFASAGGSDEGNGLRNMRQRATAAGGRLEVASAPGSGTRVRLAVPMR